MLKLFFTVLTAYCWLCSDYRNIGKGEIWYYDYKAISYIPFVLPENGTTVFEFNSKGIVAKKYKTDSMTRNISHQ